MTTKIVLLATLLAVGVAVADVLRRGKLDAPTTAAFLLLFSALFVLRVVGQIVVALRAPAWLPPMDEWNLVPYRLLLPIQLAFLAVMALIVGGLALDEGVLARRDEGFGRFLIAFSILYAASMAVRYALRMWRRPPARWFGGAIPIVFHVVLAAFLFTWGSYHAAG